MTTLDTLTARNQEFAAHNFTAIPMLMPALRTIIVGCADPRVDPALLFGLNNGESLVIRNIGGRITPDTLRAMRMLMAISQASGAPPAGDFNLIVLHHTDCGITRLAHQHEMLAEYFEIETAHVPAKAVSDPYAAVAVDVGLLRANPMLPRQWAISGLVYDVTTGKVETVVAPEHPAL